MDSLKKNGLFLLAAIIALAGFFVPAGIMLWMTAAVVGCAALIQQDARFGALATAGLCAGSNGYLLSRKFATSGSSLCNVNATINCDVVNASAASELFGIPITLFGFAFYAGLALAAIFASKQRQDFDRINGLFAIVNLAYSVYLGWEATQLGAVCIMCLTIYAGNALLLWAALAALKKSGHGLFDDVQGAIASNSFLTITAVFFVSVLLGRSMWNARPGAELINVSKEVASSASYLSRLMTTPRGPVSTDGTEPTVGNSASRYEIVEFADFSCPHCAKAWPELHQLLQQVPDVHLRFKVFPLTGECNPSIQATGSPERCTAAYASECGRQQGKFDEITTLLFTNLQYRADSDLLFMAKQAGLDIAAFQACMSSPATREGVMADGSAGARAGVHGTPALFLKGTHGDDYVELTQGTLSALRLIEAHRDGVQLPAPGPPVQDGH